MADDNGSTGAGSGTATTDPVLGTQADQTAHATLAPAPLESGFQREEVDAAVRGEAYVSPIDQRGVAIATEAAARLVEEFGDRVLEWKNFRDEITVVVPPEAIVEVLTFLRDMAGFALLSDLSPCDWLDKRDKRFAVSYHVTRLVAGAPRLRVQVWVDEGESIPSVIPVHPTADWHEREAFDFFGIEFTGRQGLRRLIMPDDWVGHPLRKDYPMGGEPVKFTNSLREI
jgi:NADH-quinone oxidoreductase subunit C